MNRLTNLATLLADVESFDEAYAVAFRDSENLSPQSEVYVFDLDALADDGDLSSEAIGLGFNPVSTLVGASFMDIVANGYAQKETPMSPSW